MSLSDRTLSFMVLGVWFTFEILVQLFASEAVFGRISRRYRIACESALRLDLSPRAGNRGWLRGLCPKRTANVGAGKVCVERHKRLMAKIPEQ